MSSPAMIGFLTLPLLPVEAELRRRPELVGSPVALYDRSRLTALSPQAEEVGLRAGMTLGQAAVICSGAVLMPYDHDRYEAAQEQVLAWCADHSPVIEPVSLGELFLELPKAGRLAEMLAEITGAVRSQIGFTCWGGVGSSKLVAKTVALERPGGVIETGAEADFLAPLPLSQLWRLEERMRLRLEDLGLSTIGLLQRIPQAVLAAHLGSLAGRLKEWSLGVDRSPVQPLYPSPAAEARLAFEEGISDWTLLVAALVELASRITSQLQCRDQTGRQVMLEIETELASCSQQIWLSHAISGASEIVFAAQALLARASPQAAVRSLKLTLSGLDRRAKRQLSLLDDRAGRRPSHDGLGQALTLVRRRFGAAGVKWAYEIEVPRRERVLSLLLGEGR